MSASKARIRPGEIADFDRIVALERATEHAPHWPAQTYNALLDGTTIGQRALFVAEFESGLAGFAVGMVQQAARSHRPAQTKANLGVCVAELESIVVAPSARRAGIGRALCRAVLEWCRTQGATEIVLEVRAGSAAAIGLYTGLGFMRTGSRPRYYSGPEEDALLMRLALV
jgi:ribosomal-protein-alanine N-acetyltransferase